MDPSTSTGLNKRYVAVVSLLTFVLPAAGIIAEIWLIKAVPFSIGLAGKWFIFFAVGLRLFVAGLKQTTDPAFTAKQIFHLHSADSFPIVRELGFANLCFGLVAILSLWLPLWRVVSAFGSGLYYGLAAMQHLVKQPAGANERFALVTDLVISGCLAVYFIQNI